MKLTSKQLQENYQKLIGIIDDTFVDTDDNERHTKLREMYDYFEDRIVVAPASGKEHYHYSFAGGYVLHILHIVDISKQLSVLYKKMGGTIDFTEEELVFSALHHDFGKLGDLDHEYYIPNDDDWRRKKLKEWYTHNKDLDFMTVHDRALWILAKYNVDLNPHVYKAILCADGMFDPSAEVYFRAYNDTRHVLGSIIHFGDWLSTICEKQNWMQSEEEHSEEHIVHKKSSDKDVKNMKKKFDELFA